MSKEDQKLLEHFRNPKNVGVIENADGFGRVENPVNGYTTDIYLKIENEQITDIKFKTMGCIATIASASALTEIIKGKTLDEIVNRDDTFEILMQWIKKELGEVPEKNWHCLPTAIQTLLVAISDYYKKNNLEERLKRIERVLNDVKCYFKAGLEE